MARTAAVQFSPKAIQDIQDIGDYIFRENPRAARKIVSDLRDRCQKLAFNPNMGAARPEIGLSVRSVALGNYVIFYVMEVGLVRIQRIMHGARDILNEYEKQQ